MLEGFLLNLEGLKRLHMFSAVVFDIGRHYHAVGAFCTFLFMCWRCSQVLLVVYEFVRQFVVFHESKGFLQVVDALFLIFVAVDDVRRLFARFRCFAIFF